jgi:hypothetical protein
MPPPVRVKLYGFLTLSRRAYLILLGLGAALAAGLLVVWLLTPTLPEPQPPEAPPVSKVWFWMWSYLPLIVLSALLLGALEAILVLRKFARAEALQRTSAAEAPPPPPKAGG